MAARVEKQILEQLEAGATVVTVNSRLARAVVREYELRQCTAGRLAWTAPDVLPLDRWLQRCWRELGDALSFAAGAETSVPVSSTRPGRRTRRTGAATTDLFDPPLPGQLSSSSPHLNSTSLPLLLSPHGEQLVWELIITESPYGHALLQIGATARQARQAWSMLRQWKLGPEHLHAPLPDDAFAFREWAAQFLAVCTAREWIDLASLPDVLTSAFEDQNLEASPNTLVLGFDAPPPQLKDLFRAAAVSLLESDSRTDAGSSRLLVFSTPAEELENAARWARGLLEAAEASRREGLESDPGPAIGVVVPDLNERRAEVERVFGDILHPAAVLPAHFASSASSLFNISLGHRLASIPLVRSALLLLELTGADEVEVEKVGFALRSPFFEGATEEATARARVDAELRAEGKLWTSLRGVYRAARKLPAEACPKLRRGLAALRRLQGARQRNPFRTASAWSQEFVEVLRQVGWPGGRSLISAEFQARSRWQDLLTQFQSLDTYWQSKLDVSRGTRSRSRASAAASLFPYSTALAQLRQLAAEEVFQPQSTSSAPIQVLGLLEASAGLQFDHLWVMGLHEESWPPPAHPNPFLPLDLQKRLGMPHSSPDWELSFAQRTTDQLLRAAPDVIVSCPEQDGDQELRPSPLVADLPRPATSAVLAVALSPVQLYCDLLHSRRSVETVEEVSRVPLLPGERERLRGGTRIFTDQAACAFRAFARHRLGARGLEKCSSGPAPADRGIMVHRALERLWGRLGTSDALTHLPDSQLRTIAASAARRAVEECFSDPSGKLASLEADRLERLLLEWIRVERERAPFTVVRRESRRQVEFGGLVVEAVIDRVDRLADGSLVIIDYKTSRPSVRDWFGERPAEPQLPIYCAASADPIKSHPEDEESPSRVAAVAFAQIRTGEMRFLGMARPGTAALPGVNEYTDHPEIGFHASWEAVVADWGEKLHKLGADFLAGEIRINPNRGPDTCAQCDLGPLCRVGERMIALGTEDENAPDL